MNRPIFLIFLKIVSQERYSQEWVYDGLIHSFIVFIATGVYSFLAVSPLFPKVGQNVVPLIPAQKILLYNYISWYKLRVPYI